jgi:hypothetical protein
MRACRVELVQKIREKEVGANSDITAIWNNSDIKKQ